MGSTWRRLGAGALCLTLSACTLSRPHYTTPDVAVGEPAVLRTVEAQTDAELVRGNRAQVLRNGDEIFPAMLAAIRGAKQTITFANFISQSIKSSPASGAAEGYVLFLLAIDAARASILITNLYFVPDGRMTDAFAAKRGVDVQIITAGVVDTTLDRIVREPSQAHFGRVLEAGAKIYEYGPALLLPLIPLRDQL